VKILIISSFFYPDRAGIAAVSTDLAEALVERGHSVTVRCAYPYYPEWRDKSGRNGLVIEHEKVGTIDVERFGIWIPRDPTSLVGRLLQEISFFASLLRRPSARRFDATVVFCPLVSTVAYALLLRLARGPAVMASVQDLPAEAAASARMSGPGLARFFGLVQGWLLSRCDVLTTISPDMRSRLARHLRSRKPVHVVPNWLSRESTRALGAVTRTGSPGGPPRLVYAGNIGGKQGLADVVRLLGATPDAFELRVFGEGSEKQGLVELVASLDDPRISVGPFLSLEEFFQEVADADWFLLPELGGASAPFFPSKLVSVIALGCPVLAVCDRDGPLGREIAEFGLGVVMSWDQIRNGVRDAVQDAAAYSANCKSRAAYYSREVSVERITAILLEATGRQPAATP